MQIVATFPEMEAPVAVPKMKSAIEKIKDSKNWLHK
jgi:hypothetical protein